MMRLNLIRLLCVSALALRLLPEGAHAAAIGLLEEPAAKEEPAVRDLVRSLSAQR